MSADSGTPVRWRVTGFLALVAAINFADRSAFNAVMAPLQKSLHLSDAHLGLLASLFLWSYAIASPFAGNLADRASRSTLIILTLAAWSLCTFLTGAANALALLCLLRLGLGVSESVFSPAAFALVADHHGSATRGRAMSILSLSFQVGIVVGAACAGYLAERYGWRAGFFVLGTCGLAVALAARFFLADRPRSGGEGEKPTAAAAFRFIGGVPCFYVVMLKQLLVEMGTWVLLTWIPLFLYETYHIKLGEAGLVGMLMLSGALVAGMALGGWVSDAVGARQPRHRMALLGLYYLVAAPFLLVFLLRPSFALVVAAMSVCSVIRGMGTATERPLLCDIIPAPHRSTVFGFYNSIANLGAGAGVLLTGIFKQSLGLNSVFACLSVLFVISSAVLFLGYWLFLPADLRRAKALAS